MCDRAIERAQENRERARRMGLEHLFDRKTGPAPGPPRWGTTAADVQRELERQRSWREREREGEGGSHRIEQYRDVQYDVNHPLQKKCMPPPVDDPILCPEAAPGAHFAELTRATMVAEIASRIRNAPPEILRQVVLDLRAAG